MISLLNNKLEGVPQVVPTIWYNPLIKKHNNQDTGNGTR